MLKRSSVRGGVEQKDNWRRFPVVISVHLSSGRFLCMAVYGCFCVSWRLTKSNRCHRSDHRPFTTFFALTLSPRSADGHCKGAHACPATLSSFPVTFVSTPPTLNALRPLPLSGVSHLERIWRCSCSRLFLISNDRLTDLQRNSSAEAQTRAERDTHTETQIEREGQGQTPEGGECWPIVWPPSLTSVAYATCRVMTD